MGVFKSKEKKDFEFNLKQAKQGDINAQLNVGLCYHEGCGVMQSYENAAYWLAKAAQSGNITAQFLLGSQYTTGKGVKQSFEKAVYWIKKAAEQGDEDAKECLIEFHKKGY